MLLYRQPWKTLHLLRVLALLTIEVPFWVLRAVLFPSSRPHRSWSATKTVSLYATRKIISLVARLHLGFFGNNIEIPDSAYKNTKFVWIEGEREENIRGQVKIFADRARVKPSKTSAFWYYKPNTLTKTVEIAKIGEKVVYYIHGGAFFHGTAHPAGAFAPIPKGILQGSKILTRILALDYHLCSSAPFEPENPFPTALLDVIAGYRYLLELGFTSENISVAGDSAGGNLALALIRYLKETDVLPMPGRLVLLSLWGDPPASNNSPESSFKLNYSDIFANTDTVIEEDFLGYGIRSYLGAAFDFEADAKRNPYISPTSPHIQPADEEYRGYPKSFIIFGSMEKLKDDSIIMADYLRKDNPGPNHVTVHSADGAIHDFLLFSWAEPERTDTFLRINQWLEE